MCSKILRSISAGSRSLLSGLTVVSPSPSPRILLSNGCDALQCSVMIMGFPDSSALSTAFTNARLVSSIGPTSSTMIKSAFRVASSIALTPTSSNSDLFTMYLPTLGPSPIPALESTPTRPEETSRRSKPMRAPPCLTSEVVIPPILIPKALSFSAALMATVVFPEPGRPVRRKSSLNSRFWRSAG